MDKSGKLLAWSIKKMQAERTIHSIKVNNLTMDPFKINYNFRDFYKVLYKSEYKGERTAQNTFRNQLRFPAISYGEKITLGPSRSTNNKRPL